MDSLAQHIFNEANRLNKNYRKALLEDNPCCINPKCRVPLEENYAKYYAYCERCEKDQADKEQGIRDSRKPE